MISPRKFRLTLHNVDGSIITQHEFEADYTDELGDTLTMLPMPSRAVFPAHPAGHPHALYRVEIQEI